MSGLRDVIVKPSSMFAVADSVLLLA